MKSSADIRSNTRTKRPSCAKCSPRPAQKRAFKAKWRSTTKNKTVASNRSSVALGSSSPPRRGGGFRRGLERFERLERLEPEFLEDTQWNHKFLTIYGSSSKPQRK